MGSIQVWQTAVMAYVKGPSEGSCLCDIDVVESAIFGIMPEIIFEALSKMYVGVLTLLFVIIIHTLYNQIS